jgi:quercetin dioxygenase-like cupin family protein
MTLRTSFPLPPAPAVMAGLLAGLFLAAASAATPPSKTTVLENDRVRAQVNVYPPGARGDAHTHAVPRVVVVLEGGTLEMTDASGATRRLEVRSGDVVWRPAETHAVANPGSSPVRLVEIDVLDCPRP